MHKILVFLLLLFLSGPAAAQSDITAVTGATVINPDDRPPIKNAVILIRSNRIERVGPGATTPVPAGAKVIDAAGKWIIPGLIDGHVHFFQSGGLYTRPDAVDLRKAFAYEKEVAGIRENLSDTFARWLRSGVTSVVDVGGPMWNFDVRQLAEKSEAAPRVLAAGPLISTYKPPVLSDIDDAPIIRANTPDEARELVRRQVPRKPDLIKIWYVVLPNQTADQFLPIVQATIDESRKHGIRVAVHATELETARAAVKAGAEVLVHSVTDKLIDEEFLRLVKERGVVYTPTLVVEQNYFRTFSQQHAFAPAEFEMANPFVMGTLFDLRHIPTDIPPKVIQNFMSSPRPIQPPTVAMKNLKILVDAGAVVAFGTDAGNIGTLHGPSIFREMKMMADAGLTPRQILAAATSGGAKLMNREKDLGSIEAGKMADIVILDADPIADILNTTRISTVIKDGRIFGPGDLIKRKPEDVVQQQLNAYNARDVDAFVATYSPDVKLFHFPDKLMSTGHNAMRKTYGEMFRSTPKLHCEVTKRMVQGNFVIDHERVTGLPNGGTINAVAIYEVKDGMIQNVWFIR